MANTSIINQIQLANGDIAQLAPYHSLTIGDTKYDGSAPMVISASNLGLSQAMKFIGTTATNIADGSTTSSIIVNNKTVQVEAGNVVLDTNGHLEYVWTGSRWELLGQDGSYALSSIKITGTNGLKGGGSLTSDLTISIDYSGSNAPVMNGNVNVGTSVYPAHSDHVHPHDSTKFDVTGGKITGAVEVDGNIEGKYITGTWLRTTATTDQACGRVAVLDNSGWVYSRTPVELRGDMNINCGTNLPSSGADGAIYFKLV